MAVVTARSLSPGEEGVLDITFDGKKRGGQQEKTVRVSTNDPDREMVVLTVKAFIRTPLIIEPKVARIGPLGPGEERVVTLRLLIDERVDLTVRRISSSASGISGRIVDNSEDTPEDLKGRILEVKVAAGRPPGKFQETLTLHTTSPSMPEVEVPVIGVVLAE